MKKLKSILSVAAMAALGVTMVSPAASAQLVDEPDTTVTVHKLQYDNTVTEVTNTGDEMTLDQFGTEVAQWDKAQLGDVGYTLYKLDDAQVSSANITPQAMADAVAADLTAYGATVSQNEILVDDQGVVSFANVAPGNYVLIESTVPATVENEAKPMFLALPLTNADGDGYRDVVHVYPKNQFEELAQNLIKYVHRNADADAVTFDGAAFDLYSGTPGSGELIADSNQLTGANGTAGEIVVTGLSVGSYYFVETATNDEAVMLDPTMINDVTNKLTFEYNANGTITYPEDSLLAPDAQVINYEKPTITKTVVDEREINAYNIGDVIDYSIELPVPWNVATYTEYTLTDRAVTGVTIDVDTVAVEGLVKDQDYTVAATPEGDGYIIDFVETNLAGVQGTTLNVTYNAQINDTAVAGADQVNTATINWNNGHETGDASDTDQVKTYEHKLHKLGEGLFNTGIDRESLGGAEFNVYRVNAEGVNEYMVQAVDSVTWDTDQTQATVFTTAEGTGEVTIKGLMEGTYFAEEIKAPENYRLPLNPVTEFVITDHGVDEASTTEVINVENPDMPMTGTEKTILTVGGLLAILAGGYAASRMSKKQAA